MGKDALPKYLGVKLQAGQNANPGNILVKQRGTHFIAGKNVKKGNDDTLYAVKAGRVKFITKNKLRFDGKKKAVKIVSVEP